VNYFVIFCFVFVSCVLLTACLYVCAVSVIDHMAVDSVR
jgi:hypothetical protein